MTHWRGSRGHKYGAKAVTIDGIRFASQAEGKRYAELVLLARAGEIRELAIQPRYDFDLDGVRMFTYVADFAYTDLTGRQIVEDAKGVKTPIFQLKKKIIEQAHGIVITEIKGQGHG